MITLEDILEEIVGEIKDEFDDEEPVYTRINESTFVFEAKTALNEVCRIVELNPEIFEDVDGEKDTLAGLLLELNQSIPRVGEVISYKNLQFTIEAADRRKIKRVKLSISKENQTE